MAQAIPVTTPSSIRLLLPIPPSTNNLYVNTRGTIRSRRKGVPYKLWFDAAGWEIKRQLLLGGVFSVPGIVTVDIRAPLNRRRDLDNSLKALLDLLVKMRVIEDDNLIDDLRIRRAGTGDRMTVEIRSMEALDGKHVAA